jgi:acyl-coenzyme A thioesterase PaaI-like protein
LNKPSPQRSPAKQPNSRHCFVCGLENPYGLQLTFYGRQPGRVEATYAVPERFQGYPGKAHGGIVAALLDEIVGRAAMVDDPLHFMVTAKIDIRYRRPIPVEQPLRLVGVLGRQRGRRATARGELYLPDGRLGADAEAMLVDADVDPLAAEALGWRVYPDGPASGPD